jgi:hypothetical protein
MADELGTASAENAAGAQETLTLSTMCACGHSRKDHRGLSIEAKGCCLECGCEEFGPLAAAPESHDATMETIPAALEQVEDLQAIVASLRAQLVAAESHQVKRVRSLRRSWQARSERS